MKDERSEELRDLVTAANNLNFPMKLRTDAVESIGRIGTHEALLALLDMAGNDQLSKKERELIIKLASNLIKSGF
ncbi:MAG: hypothetical protein A2158_01155 [Chloroflexi bacterium RBG_13_46_14]|nr:MAG: hypothetical protein A2158_01155 [Chloroflexi bacterium RBG_13_46_14]